MPPIFPAEQTPTEEQSESAPVQTDAHEAAAPPRNGHERLTPHPNERAWIERARAGELAAFDWLMNRYRARALRLAAHILRRPGEEEDLVQEAFLRAFAQIHEFRGDSGFYTWLYRIVVRLCLNRRRFAWWNPDPDSLRDVLAYFQNARSREQSTVETRVLVEQLLDNLTPPLRAALVLRELEGLEYAEIAAVLEIPVGTVRSRLSSAREQFRGLWQRALKETENA